MAITLADYFTKQGQQVVETSFRQVVGKPTSYVQDDATYRMHVIQLGWRALPVGIRLLLKAKVQEWDALYLSLKDKVLDTSGALVALTPNAPLHIFVGVNAAFCRTHVTGSEALPSPCSQANPPPTMSASNDESAGTPAEEDLTLAVGIDLGTTFSVVAYVDAQGQPRSLTNLDGERLTPSVVQFNDDGVLVGKRALQCAGFEPERTAICVKRDMGAKFYHRPINGENLPPEVISAFILRSLKEDAVRHLGPVRRAVITVPAYFDESRRRATMDAGRLAGLDVLDVINEPTAAAIAYGHQSGFLDKKSRFVGNRPLRALVFDLGGGTFDVTIVEISRGAFCALATDGDVRLGGRDWDEKLLDFVAERFQSLYQDDPRDNPISAQELWVAVEAAKRTLSERPTAMLKLNHQGKRVAVEVSRQEFEQVTAPLLERTRLTTEIVLRQASLTFAQLDRILLVGGSTRMPMVIRMLEELSGKTSDHSVSLDEAVAHGAALYAAKLMKPTSPPKAHARSGTTKVAKTTELANARDPVRPPDEAPKTPVPVQAPIDADEVTETEEGDVTESNDASDFSVVNVNSHSLGILGTDPATGAKFNKILIPKNTALPCTVRMQFQTYRHGQRSVLIKILEGEREKPELCTLVGECRVSDLPPDLPAGWPIEVRYTYQSNGALSLSAQLRGYNCNVVMDFQRENQLPDEDLEIWANYVEGELASG